MVTGEWSGTLCLTEPHAGTDLGLMRTKAEPVKGRSLTGAGKNGVLWPIFSELQKATQAASDHAALFVDLDL